MLDLANEINARLGVRRVCVLDLGGGMPVDYGSDAPDAEQVAAPRRPAGPPACEAAPPPPAPPPPA